MLRRFIFVLSTLAVCACGGVGSPCAVGDCPDETRCDFDGTCRPVALGEGIGFTQSMRLEAVAAASVSRSNPGGRASQGDLLRLGGLHDARIYLAFDLPERSRGVDTAVVILHPHPSFDAGTTTAVVTAIETRPFEADTLTTRNAPRGVGSAVAAREEAPPMGRPLRLDVTDLLRREDGEARRLFLRVEMARGGDDNAWRLAGRDAQDVDLLPQLEIRLR